LFTCFWYQAGTWLKPRWVVAKAEANDKAKRMEQRLIADKRIHL